MGLKKKKEISVLILQTFFSLICCVSYMENSEQTDKNIFLDLDLKKNWFIK